MAKKFAVALDLQKFELQNPRMQNLAGPPATPVEGQFYYDSVSKTGQIWNGTSWLNMGASSTGSTPSDGSVTDVKVATNAAIAESKLALASDAAATTASRRTLSITSATAAMPGGTRLDQLATSNPATAAISANNQRVTSVADPTADTDASNKRYVDAARAGLNVKDSVRAATTVNLAANYANGTSGAGATLTASTAVALPAIDGVTLANGNRLMVKDQTTGLQNGIYVVTTAAATWVLTRATDADTAAEVTGGMHAFVDEGLTQADSSWVLTSDGANIIGTTALTFAKYSQAGEIFDGAGMTKTGNTLNVIGTANRITVNADSVDIASTYVGQTSITTLGTVTVGTWTGTAIAVANGGTGSTTAAGARTNLGAMGRFAQTIGDGTATAFVLTHGLTASQDVIASVRTAASPFEEVLADVEYTSTTQVTVRFGVAPAASQYRVVVIG